MRLPARNKDKKEPVLARDANLFAKALVGGLDRAAAVQSSVIIKYVEGLRRHHRLESNAELQKYIDKHFLNIISSTGAAAGASAAIPGVGLVTGSAAIGAESLVFLDAAAWYILASAYLRGDDITEEQRRRALILLVLTGSKGSAIVDTFMGDMGSVTSVAALSRFSGPTLSGVNGHLSKQLTKQIAKKVKWAWVPKLMPLGIGAALGVSSNRKLARQIIKHARNQLSPLPSR